VNAVRRLRIADVPGTLVVIVTGDELWCIADTVHADAFPGAQASIVTGLAIGSRVFMCACTVGAVATVDCAGIFIIAGGPLSAEILATLVQGITEVYGAWIFIRTIRWRSPNTGPIVAFVACSTLVVVVTWRAIFVLS
jgi:hypothetical protein